MAKFDFQRAIKVHSSTPHPAPQHSGKACNGLFYVYSGESHAGKISFVMKTFFCQVLPSFQPLCTFQYIQKTVCMLNCPFTGI